MDSLSSQDLEQAQSLHNSAMDHAEVALLCRMRGDGGGFETATKQALELETQAALIVAGYSQMEPSRSVLLRSAASLALDLHYWQQAERLICTALAGSPPEEIAEELRDLLAQAYSERRLQKNLSFW